MAAIVVSRTDNYFDPFPRTPQQALMIALENQNQYAQANQHKILGKPQFIVYGTTDTNTADSDAINLSDNGVVFPDGTARMIHIRAYVADVDGQGVVEAKAIVDGGATPIVVQDAASADPLVSGLGGTPALDIEVVSGEVVIEAVGITDVDCRWVIEVYVGDLVSLAYIPTT